MYGERKADAVFVHIAVELGFRLAQRIHGFIAVELIDFGQDAVDRFTRRGEPFQHLDVQVGERTARIHDQDQARQLLAALHIVAQQALPVQFGRARDFRVAVARQVDQQAFDLFDDGGILAVLRHVGAADGEVVDVLGTARCLGGERQAFLITQDVDGGRFTGIGAAGKSDFRHRGIGQVTQLVDGRKEAGLPEF